MPLSDALIETRAVRPFFKNGFILACPVTREAAYIDPGDEAEEMLDWIRAHDVNLTAIVNTHGHLDHISGVGTVKASHNVPIMLHQEDEALYSMLKEQASWFGLSYSPAPPVDRYIADGDILRVGQFELKVHHTPGHSPGSVCLETGPHIFCGDLIFAGSVGRTDLPGGSFEALISSIRNKLFTLGDEKMLHCGHGPDTTIGQERRENPFLR